MVKPKTYKQIQETATQAIKISEYGLLCPFCGGNNLHQVRTEIYERDEDARKGLHVLVTANESVILESMEGNPSFRRHGLKIQFVCETCPDEPWLKIYQHKGSTFIEWQDAYVPLGI